MTTTIDLAVNDQYDMSIKLVNKNNNKYNEKNILTHDSLLVSAIVIYNHNFNLIVIRQLSYLKIDAARSQRCQ